MNKLLMISVLLLLAGCASGVQSIGGGLKQFAVKDMKAAHASAVLHNDVLAAQCWEYMMTAMPDALKTEVIGPATAYQKARNIRRIVELSSTDDFLRACSPMIADSRSVIRRLVSPL